MKPSNVEIRPLGDDFDAVVEIDEKVFDQARLDRPNC